MWNRRSKWLKIVLISPWIQYRNLLFGCIMKILFVLVWCQDLWVTLRWRLNRILTGGIITKQWVHHFVFFQIFWNDPLILSMGFHALVPQWFQFCLFWNRRIWKHGNAKSAFTTRHLQMRILNFANWCKIFAHNVEMIVSDVESRIGLIWFIVVLVFLYQIEID